MARPRPAPPPTISAVRFFKSMLCSSCSSPTVHVSSFISMRQRSLPDFSLSFRERVASKTTWQTTRYTKKSKKHLLENHIVVQNKDANTGKTGLSQKRQSKVKFRQSTSL